MLKEAKIIDLKAVREKKNLEESISKGRVPLYSTRPYLRESEEDFGARMQRIKDSLERINQLMTELRKNEYKN